MSIFEAHIYTSLEMSLQPKENFVREAMTYTGPQP